MSTFSNRLSVLWLDKYRSFTYMVMDWPASMNARNRITHSIMLFSSVYKFALLDF